MNKKLIFPITIISFILFTSLNCFSAEVHLYWDSSSGTVTGYRLYYGTSSGNHPNMVEVGDVTDYILTGLEENITYYIIAKAFNDYGESAGSNEFQWIYESNPIPPPVAEGVIEAESGTLSAPMQIVSDSGASEGAYVQTTTVNTGTVTYNVNIETPGTYKIIASVYAATSGNDSFFVQIDGQEEVLWDLNPTSNPNEYNVWREDDVTKRGTGTYDNPQFDPYTIEMSQGVHTITFRGREVNARLDYFYFFQESGTVLSPPSAPTGVSVVIN